MCVCVCVCVCVCEENYLSTKLWGQVLMGVSTRMINPDASEKREMNKEATSLIGHLGIRLSEHLEELS